VRLRYPQGVELPELPERVQPAAAPWQDWTDVLKTQNSRFWLQHPQNWLVGELAQKIASPNQSRWGWAFALAVLAVILEIGLTRLETHRIQQQTASARAESEALYRSAFPEDRRIINLARQFKAKKAQASAVDPSQLLQLLAQTAPNAGSQIVKLEYQDAAVTRVDIISPALSDISQWAAQLNAAGVSTQVENSRFEDGIAKAKLQLRVSTGGQ
jgi:type II secretory pathway component PulL